MNERIVQFGEDGRLCGVLRDGVRTAPAALLFNAGVIHRIGAHRLNVKIARMLAGPSLRFDLAGQGDSDPAPAGSDFEVQAVTDIAAAIDLLRGEAGMRPVIAIGMCSGADHALRAAAADERLSRLILLDPYAYENRKASRAEFLSRISDADRWARRAGSMFVRDRRNPQEELGLEAPPEQGRSVPEREAFGEQLQTLTEQGVEILIVYTGFVRRFLSHPAHFYETFSDFDFARRVTVRTIPETDHTYVQCAAQNVLIETINNWIAGTMPRPAQ